MQKYELTVLLSEKATAAKKKSISEKVTKLIETFKGKVGKVEDWEEKVPTGVYLYFPLELEKESAGGLSAKLKAEEEVVKYLLIRKD